MESWSTFVFVISLVIMALGAIMVINAEPLGCNKTIIKFRKKTGIIGCIMATVGAIGILISLLL